MISHSDIELGKIGTFPSTFLFPLLSTLISKPENTKKRNQEILIERVPNEPNIPIPHTTQKPNRVDPVQVASMWDPFPRVNEGEILTLVSDAVPGVSVKGAGVVVEEERVGAAIGIEDPVTFEEVTVGGCE